MSSGQEKSTLPDTMGGRHSSAVYHGIPERPNHMLEVRIRLEKKLALVLSSLETKFEKDGMKVREDANVNNVIVVSGIPPDYEYDNDKVLKKVKTEDAGARII